MKDNIDVAGMPTTAACPDYQYHPEKDATVVALLRAAGAIPIGKTNLDQFATGLVGVRSPYPIPKNAIDPKLVPGGSSSGSAVATSQGIVSFALGTDTAGSGRIPAGLNNIVGLKPTVGALSTTGVIPACGLLQVSDPERFQLRPNGYFWDRIAEVTDAYLHGAELNHPLALDLADPLVALERGEKPERPLPPFFLPCGSWDVLKEDSVRLAAALNRLGGRAEARIYPRGPHAFHAFVFTPSALKCWRDTFEFMAGC